MIVITIVVWCRIPKIQRRYQWCNYFWWVLWASQQIA